MSMKIILISIGLFLILPLWPATQEGALEQDCLIRTRRLSEHPIENLEEKQLIGKDLHRFFASFDQASTNLMVLHNLCGAMKGGTNFVVQIWENYVSEHAILKPELVPLFRTVYGDVLKALRKDDLSYFNPRDYFKSSCFLELLYGELGAESFPSNYLRPLVFAEWRIYQQTELIDFAQDFSDCLNRLTQKMSLALAPTEKDCKSWHTLSIENLQARKSVLDFSECLQRLEALKSKSRGLCLKKTTTLCAEFRSSLESFHKASVPLSQEIERIIKEKESPEKKTSPSQVGQYLLNWSIKGGHFSEYVLPTSKGSNPASSPILESLRETLRKDAAATPIFTLAENGIKCDQITIENSETSIEIFLKDIWPTLHLFFTEGGLVPFSVYGAHHSAETQTTLDGLAAKIDSLKLTVIAEKEALETSHRHTLAELRGRSLILETEKEQLDKTLKSEKAQLKRAFSTQKALEKKLKEAQAIKKPLEDRLQEMTRKFEETQKMLEALKTPVPTDRIKQLELDILTLQQAHQQKTLDAQAGFEKELEALRKDAEGRLQEATEQLKLLQEQVKERAKQETLREVSSPLKAAPEETISSLPQGSVAESGDIPPALQKDRPLPPTSTRKWNERALAFRPASEFRPALAPPTAFFPPSSTLITPDGMRWIVTQGSGWVPAYPYPPYSYP